MNAFTPPLLARLALAAAYKHHVGLLGDHCRGKDVAIEWAASEADLRPLQGEVSAHDTPEDVVSYPFGTWSATDLYWWSCWYRRAPEIRAGKDPLAAAVLPDGSPDYPRRAQSSIACLARLIRQQAPAAWRVIRSDPREIADLEDCG